MKRLEGPHIANNPVSKNSLEKPLSNYNSQEAATIKLREGGGSGYQNYRIMTLQRLSL